MAERAAGAGGYHQDPDVYPFDLLLRSLVGIRLFRPSKDWVFTGERFRIIPQSRTQKSGNWASLGKDIDHSGVR